jgi:uncharacterized surface anchored protein
MDKDYQNFVGRMGSFDDTLEVETDFVKHYGKIGMHWGRRSGRSGTLSKKMGAKLSEMKTHSTDSEDFKQKQTLKTKKIREMSNADLQTLNTRLQLERSYKDLSKQDMSAGRKYANDVLVNSSKQALSNVVIKGMSAGLDSLLKKAIKPKGPVQLSFVKGM